MSPYKSILFQNHHQNENTAFSSPPKFLHALNPFSQPAGLGKQPSVLIDGSLKSVTEWNHAVGRLLHLASFTERDMYGTSGGARPLFFTWVGLHGLIAS